MCEWAGDQEYGSVCSYEWRHARKPRDCCACGREIPKRDRYHRTAILSDGAWTAYTHCATCWKILELLFSQQEDQDQAINFFLNCGNEYQGPEDDPAHSLAFMTPAEAQAWAAEQPRENTFQCTWIG